MFAWVMSSQSSLMGLRIDRDTSSGTPPTGRQGDLDARRQQAANI